MEWASELEVVTQVPPNAGTPVARQTGDPLHQAGVYVRSNFPVPAIDAGSWCLSLDVASPVELDLDAIASFPHRRMTLVMECAGNGRTLMRPVPGGTPWTLGGASVTTIEGVLLSDVLADHPVPDGTEELVFVGADEGRVARDGHVAYEFSLPVDDALSGPSMLVWAMGGEPLSAVHGAPLRLIVPGQYAMKSVKWLTSIRAIDHPFEGHFVRKYRYYEDATEPHEAPVGPIQVRSLIASPTDGSEWPAGPLEITGSAWSDGAAVVEVTVSLDDGATWHEADLTAGEGRFAPVAFRAVVDASTGDHTVVARATDDAGRRQPVDPRWNGNGYANNVVHRVPIVVA
jgi:sulfite oxidase